jgi:hypothetical protein
MNEWSFERFVRCALVLILKNQKAILNNQEREMSKLDDLKGSVTKLGTDVNAFIAANSGGATDADLDALKSQIDAIDAVVNPPAPAPAA